MKVCGRIFDIKKMAVHDGPGIRTTVFFKGCSLRCAWCHNPESINSDPELGFLERKCSGCGACVTICPTGAHMVDKMGKHSINREKCTRCFLCVDACLWESLVIYGKDILVEEVMREIIPDIAFFKESDGGVTISGGEPLVQPDFAAALLEACGKANIHTCVDTSGGVVWSSFEKVLPYTGMFLFDIKFFDEKMHIKYTGVSNKGILDNLKRLGCENIPIEIRIPLIPNLNTNSSELEKIGEIISKNPCVKSVRILPYNELAQTKYKTIGNDHSIPDGHKQKKEELQQYAELLRGYGLTVIVGE